MIAVFRDQVDLTIDNVCHGIQPNKMVRAFVISKSAASDCTKSR